MNLPANKTTSLIRVPMLLPSGIPAISIYVELLDWGSRKTSIVRLKDVVDLEDLMTRTCKTIRDLFTEGESIVDVKYSVINSELVALSLIAEESGKDIRECSMTVLIYR